MFREALLAPFLLKLLNRDNLHIISGESDVVQVWGGSESSSVEVPKLLLSLLPTIRGERMRRNSVSFRNRS